MVGRRKDGSFNNNLSIWIHVKFLQFFAHEMHMFCSTICIFYPCEHFCTNFMCTDKRINDPEPMKTFQFSWIQRIQKNYENFSDNMTCRDQKCSSFETNRICWFFYVSLIRRITSLSERFLPQQYEFQQGNLAKCGGDFFIYRFIVLPFFGDFNLEIRRILLLGEVPLWSHLQRPSQHRHDLRNLPSWFHLHARCSLFFPSQILHWPQQCTFSN